jgi:hypothetical protein
MIFDATPYGASESRGGRGTQTAFSTREGLILPAALRYDEPDGGGEGGGPREKELGGDMNRVYNMKGEKYV